MKKLISLAASFCAAGALFAHSDHDHESDRDGAATNGFPTVTIDVAEGQNPWTSLALNNDPANFQFAIITDNTTGGRPGVLEDAFKKLNWLQPEFVMSVGDLIQGYSEDRAQLKFEWDEFEGFVSKLEMPFFYVAGNHDYTNPVMAEVWKERFGASYYTFVYHDVLFVMLNSNDAKRPHAMTQPQVDWLAAELAKHPNPRWTLVFTHTPLWNFAEDRQSLWPQVDKLLEGRKHTVFAGHHHRYVKDVRNGRANYYTLATTGGSSQLRGPRFGEFDHVMWATMTDDGPILTNLVLEGILPEDIRTEKSEAMQQALINDDSLVVQPIIFDEDQFPGGRTELRFTNDTDLPVTLELEVVQTANVRFEGERHQTLLVPPNEVAISSYRFDAADLSFDSGQIAELRWKLSFDHAGETYDFASHEPINAIRTEPIPAATIAIDGDLTDWAALPYRYDADAWVYARNRVWHGRDDGDFRFGVTADDDYLYVGVEVTDNGRFADAHARNWAQDSVTIALDSRPANIRNITGRPDLNYTLVPGDEPNAARLLGENRLPEGSQWKVRTTATGYTAEIAVPVAYLSQQAGELWRDVRVNVMIADRDPGEDGRIGLRWQPEWGSVRAIPGSGTFRR
ncbi:sugar-binding protein [Synoicihabitans lomoniglobus]|uniref:Sugar-binding protein n=1 Tax=Synoicihabitans lomoniglobus TaxID=2909285 RepID=A0AAE9ZXV7_9BACT|nr:metallophosphoesterase [Opitutaceae bacterium LMO-M01]WED65159.1 sugar-binding protein [Opitutaceae bacterium LMO-M01]